MIPVAPTPAEYERMTERVRRGAVALLREEAGLIRERRRAVAARRERSRALTAEQVAATWAEAERLLPLYARAHGDTAQIQAARRDVLRGDLP
jgi:hypothetical protein